MDLISIVLIAIGLSMDAFAVALSCGVNKASIRFSQALKIGLAFGGFQALMPLLGWLAGLQLRDAIRAFDHWIAFGLLIAIGGKMIYEAREENPSKKKIDILNPKILLMLSIATSIDALVVGLSFAFLDAPILLSALLIGCVTFFISMIGVKMGLQFGCRLGKKMEIVGGLALVLIGAKILIEHLFLNG